MTGASPISNVEPNTPNQKWWTPLSLHVNVAISLWSGCGRKFYNWASYVPSEEKNSANVLIRFLEGSLSTGPVVPWRTLAWWWKAPHHLKGFASYWLLLLGGSNPRLLAKQRLICHGHPMVLTPSEWVTLNIISKAPAAFVNGWLRH